MGEGAKRTRIILLLLLHGPRNDSHGTRGPRRCTQGRGTRGPRRYTQGRGYAEHAGTLRAADTRSTQAHSEHPESPGYFAAAFSANVPSSGASLHPIDRAVPVAPSVVIFASTVTRPVHGWSLLTVYA